MKKEKIPNPYKMKRIKGPVLTEEEFKRAKIRITTHLDDEVLDMLRQLARESGSKYQSILNQILRDALLGEKKGLFARIERLEKTVFKKRAT
ncbi:MAG: BrnA antitoxin family protein [Deltaproteobacteria bacterium]|nr:BrnA antitoxin family protein [Deltaproteobacteria bacterium]